MVSLIFSFVLCCNIFYADTIGVDQPVINPDVVTPGSWFTPTGSTINKEEQIRRADDAAYRAYICAIRDNKVGQNEDCSL